MRSLLKAIPSIPSSPTPLPSPPLGSRPTAPTPTLVRDPQALKDFLSNDRHIFVGVEIAKSVNKLVRNYGLNVSNARDLRSLANNAGLEVPQDCGLKVLAKLILGWKMEKRNRVTVSQWNKLWLTSAQVRYACMDAFVALQIGKALYAA
ncbi:uncharacterized protein LOC130137342 [Syzygium oleosum]|uniref:uncharacterized protein LOC130137342 n=1 Tax=Syzygium oleosum TaxID=219896 RepID=UPI0024B90E57|nr:uncharacterized protein LOC130137342 [Syzygium oleosum]